MPTTHIVQQGEDLFVIAAKHGFRSYRTVYDDAANAALRAARPNPQILLPGDAVVIPDKQSRTESRPTGQRHQFFIHPPRRRLRIVLHDHRGRLLALEPYQLGIDGVSMGTGLQTDAAGLLAHDVPLGARRGTILARDLAWDIALADLNPVHDALDEGITGAQGRLWNLGYQPGPIDGVLGPRTAAAVRSFQGDRQLRQTGMLDAGTLQQIVAAHGC